MSSLVKDMSHDERILVTSTSLSTADITPIILNTTDRFRLQFIPTLVDNQKSPEKCISGKLVYEQKRKHDQEYPTDRVVRGDIKSGEYMEIALSTAETYALLHGLNEYYSLYSEIGQIPLGETSFARIDRHVKSALEAIKCDPTLMRGIANKDMLNLMQTLLRIFMTSESTDKLLEILSSLEAEGIDRLANIVSIDKLNRVQNILADNLENDDEEFWQRALKENAWILSQIFATPMTIIEDKAYVGGKTIDNNGGHICDFLYANEVSRNIALIEIKTPCTPIIGREYRRGIFPISNDLSGSISQVLAYRDSLIQEYNTLCRGTVYKVLNPVCVVLIGKLNTTSREITSFELFRNSLNGVVVITYDELLERVTKLIAIFAGVHELRSVSPEILDSDADDTPPF